MRNEFCSFRFKEKICLFGFFLVGFHERARSSPASIPGILTLPLENPSSPSLYSSVPVPQNQPAAAVVQQPQHFRHKSVPNPLSQASFRLCDPIINISTQFRLAYQPDCRIVFQKYAHSLRFFCLPLLAHSDVPKFQRAFFSMFLLYSKATGEIYQDSAEARDHILGPLPRDWGQTVDRGETYYVDHAAKTTTWFDPRLCKLCVHWFVCVCVCVWVWFAPFPLFFLALFVFTYYYVLRDPVSKPLGVQISARLIFAREHLLIVILTFELRSAD